MPSAYRLACDKIEQAQAILNSEIWHDQRSAALMLQLVERLYELDSDVTAQLPSAQTTPSPAGEAVDAGEIVPLHQFKYGT